MPNIVESDNQTSIQPNESAQTDLAAYYDQQPPAQGGDFEFNIIWNIFKRRWWLMLLVAIVVVSAGLVYLIKEKPVYESAALIVVSTDRIRHTTPEGSEETMTVDDLVNLAKARSLAGQIQVLQSPDLLYEAIDTLGIEKMRTGYGDEYTYQGALFPEWALTIDSPENSDLVSIKARSYNPQVAADVANTIARTYLERDQGFTTQASKQGREYIAKELASVTKRLRVAQKQLSDFKRSNNFVVPDSQIGQVATDATTLEMDYDKANIDRAVASQKVAALRRQLASEGREVEQGKSIVDNPQYKEAESRLNSLNVQRVVLLQDYRPESPEVQKIDAEIEAVQQQMRSFAKKIVPTKNLARNPYLDQYITAVIDNSSVTAKTRALSGVISKRSRQLSTMPEKERKYAILSQQEAFLQDAYKTLTQKYYALFVNEKSTLPGALFAANATVPTNPINSRRKKIPQLVVVALMLAIGSALLAEKMDRRVRDEVRLIKLTGEEPMAVIPRVKGLDNPFTKLTDTQDHAGFLEAFRILRNSIYYSDPAGTPRLLAISSPGHGEGKSTTSLCLAITIAMDGKRVLIVDCDFRRPSLYRWIDAPNDLGLSYVLAGEALVDEAIIPTKIPNLFCLPAGPLPSNPSEFLNSRVSRDIMTKLASEYDIVIMDCPPCAGLSDMQVISRLVDGVLLVASIDHTLKKRLDEGIKMLTKVHAPLMGYVVNRFNMNPKGYDYYATEDYDLPKWNKRSSAKTSTSIDHKSE